MKVGVFGGTFNPVHKGHLHLAQSFYDFLDLDIIYIIPTNLPPHKDALDIAPPQDRLEMCRLSFTEPYHLVSHMEFERGGKSYTIDSLEQIKKMHKNADIYLLIGADMFLTFDKWHRFEDILKISNLCAIARNKGEEYKLMLDYRKNVLSKFKDKVFIMKTEAYPLSSTQIRLMIKEGKPIDDYVPKKVAEYIKNRGLYLE